MPGRDQQEASTRWTPGHDHVLPRLPAMVQTSACCIHDFGVSSLSSPQCVPTRIVPCTASVAAVRRMSVDRGLGSGVAQECSVTAVGWFSPAARTPFSRHWLAR